MFSTKNISPRQLSAFTALVLAVPVSLLVYFVEKSWLWAVGSFVIILGGAYLLISVVLERFIYRKIKLIYKFIYHTKATKKEETYYKYVLPQKSIDEVREDVEAWAEENKQEIELLRRNEQFRREFLQNLSHEFKTPVFAIQGYVDTLLAGALANPDVNKKFLEKTAKNVDRLTHLLNDLDEISSLERGELVLYKQSFIIQDLIKDVFESLSLKAEENNIHCSIKKGCESPLTVFADKEKIRQVFTNLVENSIKYGRRGGNITASMYKTDGRHILIEITDDGIGINERHLPRLFERFYRTDEGRSIDVGGSGLGLSICKHIIEAHGQTIHVRSTEAIGTTVGFTLDVRRD
ncbi:MAG: sensor histidine kinase [Chitinophagaceae bacterium]|jgi:two-component system phosphate regulon sensor histidine kinase PhoR|nr:sensor histidine kinase [Chitinophagaceae bacterium]MBK7678507.1 sensor histidine kinase [Chitinophagaceae bacterium]MBK8300141.1 sensor histidine kinase [Chitinophagaceae bacterium]MBK9464185.1 sensor histidine kinase [Chitinophagaceae bacterium]MBK9658693.1 sensor histidine kinase [Chitinophagaceae bacterium]